tara:strand:+ start:2912 stop:4252 length:1341 start_codon:yes stop_codon:yes gene_type:complete
MSKTKNLLFLIFCAFLLNCSFGIGGGWNDLSKELETVKARKNAKLIFSTVKKFDEEIKNNKKIKISKSSTNQEWNQQNFTRGNRVPHLAYKNKKNLILKSKKLGKNSFNLRGVDFQPIIEKGIIFFYDPSGTIFGYSIDREALVWKYNFYRKRYKNIPKEINLSISTNNLIVSDNLGFIYSLDKNSGEIKWAKNYGVPFKSNIKIDGDDIFLVNQDNKFYVISENTGKQKTDLETVPSFLKSKNKSNVSLDDIRKDVYFITSAAEIYSVSYKNKNINWLFNLIGGGSDQQVDLFYSSPMVHLDNELIVSSALSTFSMNSVNGSLNWEFPFASEITPIVLKDYVFLTSGKGFLLSLNRKTGKVVWSGSIFKKSKKLEHKKTGDIISILFLSDQIFITTERGYFLFLDYQNGKVINYAKVSKGFFSKPIIWNETILIIDNKMRILQFN